jgi:putative NADH-flavin reductase
MHTIAILGATGRTGSETLKLLLDAGNSVHVMARDPTKITPNDNLTVIKGDVTDPAALNRLFETKFTNVIISLGSRKATDAHVCSIGTKNIITALQASKSKPRIICVTSMGAGDSKADMGIIGGKYEIR